MNLAASAFNRIKATAKEKM